MDQQKKSSQQTPPFEPGKKPAGGGAIAGKHGMSYSRVRHLARMAMKKQTKEDVEQVDELKKSTLASYAMKAADQARNKKDAAIGHVRKFKGLTSSGEIEKSTKADQRIAGVKSAIARLAKEDVNELSNELLQRYKKEAGKQVDNPATPSSMKYKRGLGHLMATVKQMKSGKPMPKESIQQEETNMDEMSQSQMKKREEVVKSMKKNFADFRKRYGEKAKSVMYATATKQAKQAMKEEEIQEAPKGEHLCAKHVYSELFGEGVVLNAQHSEPDAEGNIEWYMVEFSDGIRKVQTEDIEIMVAEYHMNHKKKMKDEEVEFEAPSSIKKEGLPHFMGAAAAAHKAGKKEFSFGGKTYPVTIKKQVASQIK